MKNILDETDSYALAIIDRLDTLQIGTMSESELKKETDRAKAIADMLRINLVSAKLRLEITIAADNFINPDTKLPESLRG